MVVQHVTGPPAPPDNLSAYWRFHEAVARARLVAWLPQSQGRRLIVDVSGPAADSAEITAMAGHAVIRVLDTQPGVPPVKPGLLRTVVGDSSRLDFLPSGCADGV